MYFPLQKKTQGIKKNSVVMAGQLMWNSLFVIEVVEVFTNKGTWQQWTSTVFLRAEEMQVYLLIFWREREGEEEDTKGWQKGVRQEDSKRRKMIDQRTYNVCT